MTAVIRARIGRLLPAASIALVMLSAAGCTDSGDPGKRLIGTWTGDPTAMLAAQKSIPDEHRKALEKLAKEARPSMKAIYRGDGTFEVSLTMIGLDQKASGTWKVIESQGDSIRVETIGNEKKNNATLDITFKGADTIEMKSSDRPGAIELTRTRDG